MKILSDGTVEGSPEELAAYQHISAAMDKTDAARTKRQAAQSKSALPRLKKKTPVKRRTLTSVSQNDVLEVARGLDHGKGFVAKDLAAAMDIPLKMSYNRLYSLRTRGDLTLKDGVYRLPKPKVAQAV